jgi:hypothetical protein
VRCFREKGSAKLQEHPTPTPSSSFFPSAAAVIGRDHSSALSASAFANSDLIALRKPLSIIVVQLSLALNESHAKKGVVVVV